MKKTIANGKNRTRNASKAQLSLELMLSFAAYAALIAAFVLAARQADGAAAPKTLAAADAARAAQTCALAEYAEINSRRTVADLPSLEKTVFAAGTASTGENTVVCGAAARSQGRLTVKQYAKEQA